MPFKKGEPRHPNAGRKKGTKNKTSQEIKEHILREFDPRKFAKWVEKNPDAFYTQLLTKCLPKEVKTDLEGELIFKFEGWQSKKNG